MEMVEGTSWPEMLHNRSVRIALLQAENLKKDKEIESLKKRIAELEPPSPPPEAMDLNSYKALRVVLDHSRDQAMRELMGKISSMQEEVEEFQQTVETAGFDFDIEHAANVLNKKLAAAGHPHRIDVEELIANTPFSTLGDWFMGLIESSDLHGCDNTVRIPQELLPFASHPDTDVHTMQVE
jgi:DNA-binding protein YbaB